MFKARGGVAGSRGAICMRNGRSNFVFVRGVVSSTFALVYKENKTLYPPRVGARGMEHGGEGRAAKPYRAPTAKNNITSLINISYRTTITV